MFYQQTNRPLAELHFDSPRRVAGLDAPATQGGTTGSTVTGTAVNNAPGVVSVSQVPASSPATAAAAAASASLPSGNWLVLAGLCALVWFMAKDK